MSRAFAYRRVRNFGVTNGRELVLVSSGRPRLPETGTPESEIGARLPTWATMPTMIRIVENGPAPLMTPLGPDGRLEESTSLI
jgi:hypothetical protein